MARGWESKAVEEMVEAKAEARLASAVTVESPEAADRRHRREGLLLSRARVERELGAARDARYRAMLERSLAHVDAAIAALDAEAQLAESSADPADSTRTS